MPAYPQPPSGGKRQTPWLAAAIALLAIAIAGATAALLIGDRSPRRASVTSPATAATAPAPAPETSTSSQSEGEDTVSTATTGNEATLPSVPPEQMQSEIQQMLLEWHEDVVQGNYHAAWELLSLRKRENASSEGGYATWMKNQATLTPYLDPAGLQVTIQSTDASEGVAQVNVTGMTWSKPGAHCREWSGITWVKYEEGAWRYDPGYSTTPQREREWRSRFAQLLGGRC